MADQLDGRAREEKTPTERIAAASRFIMRRFFPKRPEGLLPSDFAEEFSAALELDVQRELTIAKLGENRRSQRMTPDDLKTREHQLIVEFVKIDLAIENRRIT